MKHYQARAIAQAYFSKKPFNPLTTNVSHHIETSQLICSANQLTDFYMVRNTGR